MVDAGIRDYLWEIAKLVDNAGGEPADKDTLLGNVFEEISGQEVGVMLDPRCGPALEHFIPILSPELTARLLKAVVARAIDVCSDKCASRVLEKLLARVEALALAHTAGIEGILDDVTTLCGELEKESWADAICDPNGSHVVRTLIQLLAADPRNARLRGTLHSTCAAIIAAIGENMSEAIVHAHANPVVQSIIEALSPNKPFVKLVVDRIVAAVEAENKGEGEGEGEGEKKSESDKVVMISCNAVGSRLIEKILEFSSEDIFATLYTKWFRGTLESLARDRIGNHIVQKLLSSQYCQPPQAALIVTELLPAVDELVHSKGHEGVVMQMAEACATHEVCQKEFFEALHTALVGGEKKEEEEKEKEEKEEGKEGKGSKNFALELLRFPRPNYIFSRIAQALLKMDKSVARQFCEALCSLEHSFLVQMAQDSAGSRVIEAAIESTTLPVQNHAKLFETYKGSFAELAMSPGGSHVVEKFYFGSDMKNKEKIAQELLENEQRLAGDFNGKFVLRTCKVRLYREKKEIWKSGVKQGSKKREMFDEILKDGEGDAKGNAKGKGKDKGKGKGDDDEGKAKKAADKVSAPLKDDYEKFMEKLGFGSKKARSADSSNYKTKKEEKEKLEGGGDVEMSAEKVDSKDIDSLNKSVIDVLSKTKKKKKDKKKSSKRDAEKTESDEQPAKKKTKTK